MKGRAKQRGSPQLQTHRVPSKRELRRCEQKSPNCMHQTGKKEQRSSTPAIQISKYTGPEANGAPIQAVSALLRRTPHSRAQAGVPGVASEDGEAATKAVEELPTEVVHSTRRQRIQGPSRAEANHPWEHPECGRRNQRRFRSPTSAANTTRNKRDRHLGTLAHY